MAGQNAPEERNGPFFQGLRQEGVVRIAEGLPRDLPGLVPAHVMDIHEQAHQLGDADRRVGVVELDGVFLVEPVQVRVPLAIDADHVLQGAGDEEELLHQPELTAGERLVVGIEDFGQVLRADLVVDGAVVIADVERAKIEGSRRFRPEEAEHDDRRGGEAGDHRVVGDAADPAFRNPEDAITAGVVEAAFGMAAERDVVGDLRTRHLPGIPLAQPLIRHLLLPPVADFLREDAEFITDAVADGRDVEGGQRIEVAGSEAAEAAVSQPRLLFLVDQRLKVEAELPHRLPDGLVEAKIDQVVFQMGAEEKFRREVADGPARLCIVGVRRFRPLRENPVAHRVGNREVVVVPSRNRGKAALNADQVVENGLLHLLDAAARPDAGCLRRRRGLRFCRSCHGLLPNADPRFHGQMTFLSAPVAGHAVSLPSAGLITDDAGIFVV